MGAKYCTKAPSSVIPQVCNEFILGYMEERQQEDCAIERPKLISLTQHMCEWLFAQGLSEWKLLPKAV